MNSDRNFTDTPRPENVMQYSTKNEFSASFVFLATAVLAGAADGTAAGIQLEPQIDAQWYLHVPVGPMHFSPDGKQFGIRFGNILFCETATGKITRVLRSENRAPEAYIYTSFDWSPNGKHYVTGIGHSHGEMWGMVEVWNHKTGKRVLKYRAFDGQWKDIHGGGPIQVRFSPDARYLVSNFGTSGVPRWREIQVREFPGGKLLRKFRTKTHVVAISPDSRILTDGWNLWSLKTGRLLVRLTEGGRAPLERIQFSPDGNTLFVGGDNSHYAANSSVYDVKTGRQLRELPRARNPNAFNLDTGRYYRVGGRDLGFSPDGRILALQETPAGKNVLVLRDMKTGRLIHRLTGHKRGVHSVAFSPDGKLVLTGDGERTVRFWGLKSGELLRKIVLPAEKPPDSVDGGDLYFDKDFRLHRRKQ